MTDKEDKLMEKCEAEAATLFTKGTNTVLLVQLVAQALYQKEKEKEAIVFASAEKIKELKKQRLLDFKTMKDCYSRFTDLEQKLAQAEEKIISLEGDKEQLLHESEEKWLEEEESDV